VQIKLEIIRRLETEVQLFNQWANPLENSDELESFFIGYL